MSAGAKGLDLFATIGCDSQRSQPALVFNHGGPGSAEMTMTFTKYPLYLSFSFIRIALTLFFPASQATFLFFVQFEQTLICCFFLSTA